MDDKLEKSLSHSERLSSILGEGSLSGSPCNGGVCSTMIGDTRCKTCGRHEDEINKWNQLPEEQRKIINIKNAAEGFKIRQVLSQEDRWRDLQKLKTDTNKAFEKDLRVGQELEQLVLDAIKKKYPSAVQVPGKFKPYDIFVAEKNLKVEVKVDYKSQETGNIIIELYMFNKPSALLSTEADYWIIHTGKEILWAKPKKIIECIMINNIKSKEILGSGDTQKKIACLIPIELFKQYTI